MATIPYHYPRALELEGRHPADAGCWPITVYRLEVGEGLPKPASPWALVSFPDGEPFPSSRRAPPAVLFHNFYYRRIRSSAECDRHILMKPQGLVRSAFQLTAAWANPPDGLIPPPSEADPPIPHTHAATLINRFADRRLFQFRVLWRDWGDHGTGYMPYAYFDRYVFECWATYGPDVLSLFKLQQLDGQGHVRWSAHDEESHKIYAFEVRDARSDERFAWTFVIERDGALEVEELYVRPEFRRLGHGRWLADRVAQLAREKGMPLRLWVPFADCKSESENNYPALVATAQRLGVQFQPSQTPWAAYFGTTEQSGQALPVEPATIPGRPRTPRQELIAAVLALGIGSGEASLNGAPADSPKQTERVVAQNEDGAKIQADGFLEDVYRLASVNDLDGATDRIFDFIDRLLCDGKFEACDAVLRAVDVEKLPTVLMRSFLSITAAAKQVLPSRPAFFRKIEKKMVELRGVEKTRTIIENLA